MILIPFGIGSEVFLLFLGKSLSLNQDLSHKAFQLCAETLDRFELHLAVLYIYILLKNVIALGTLLVYKSLQWLQVYKSFTM